jgi:hypothetical protein
LPIFLIVRDFFQNPRDISGRKVSETSVLEDVTDAPGPIEAE